MTESQTRNQKKPPIPKPIHVPVLIVSMVISSPCPCPRQDSNLRSRLRRPALSPLSYWGVSR